MYINDIHIIYYVLVGILGLGVGQFVDWCNIRLPEYKKVFSKEFKAAMNEKLIDTEFFSKKEIKRLKKYVKHPLLVSLFS